ncbi:hypothetical protein LOTGIDRAFT_163193 [Lottia gigantea]|uniref:Uncharacterized protein n=1 Tax=Lottia gigantea TaxID=225164 RepID=V4AET2_LOTGI|nr:hypothetical protein LOTGIDRAFT_163193 [Lottia gigantea]ESO91831.1 hypothetical protein LOTGIDRAFT_163193 [Lottia gigantea]
MALEAGSNPIETIKHPGEFDTMLKTVLYPKDFYSVSGWIPDVGDGSVLKEPIRNLANDADLAVITPSIEVETRIFNSLTKDIKIAFLHRNTVGSMTLTGESTTWPITNTIKPARYLMVGFRNLPDSQTNNNNVFRVAMNQTQDPIMHKVQVRLNNDNYPNQPLTINPTTKDYNELYRNYKNMCELFSNPPQFEYVDFALNQPICCFDLSAHQEDLFKTGVNINIHIKKHKERDDIDLERIDTNVKKRWIYIFPPLVFDGLTAAGAIAGSAVALVSTANEKKAADATAAEERRHNLVMEKEAQKLPFAKKRFRSGRYDRHNKRIWKKIWGRNQENC